MPPTYQEQLNTAREGAEQRATDAETRLQDFSRSLSAVRGGDLANLQVSDPTLQTTLDSFDESIQTFDRVAGQTDQYQAAAQGAYRLGGRAANRLLREAGNQINLQLAQSQQQARLHRAEAIQDYRQATAQEAQRERALAIQLGGQAYQVEVQEEERKNRQNDAFRDRFKDRLRAGKAFDQSFISQFAESSDRKTDEVQQLYEEAGSELISDYRDLANKLGIPIKDEDLDLTSIESTISSLRAKVEQEYARRIENEEQAAESQQQNVLSQINLRSAQILKIDADIQNDKDRLAIEQQKASIAQKEGQIAAICTKEAYPTESERNKCQSDEAYKVFINTIPPQDRTDIDTQNILQGVIQRQTSGGKVVKKGEFDTAIRRKIGSDQKFARILSETYKHIPSIREAIETGDIQQVQQALMDATQFDIVDETIQIPSYVVGELYATLLQRTWAVEQVEDTREPAPTPEEVEAIQKEGRNLQNRAPERLQTPVPESFKKGQQEVAADIEQPNPYLPGNNPYLGSFEDVSRGLFR